MKSNPHNGDESEILPAIAFAENIARHYADSGGNVVDLFAAFVGIVVEKDEQIGLVALEATDRFLSKTRRPS